MKFIKEVNGKEITLEETNVNHYSILERLGFKEVKPPKTEAKKK